MKNSFLVILLLVSHGLFAQSNFPDLSPSGLIIQKVGFTIIEVSYERPAVRGRKIFGELVPYDKLWRTGAGNCTKISFSQPVMIGGKSIDAGKYSLFTIPGKTDWTVILNRDTTLYGTQSYDTSKDVARFAVKSGTTSRHYESFTIDVDVVPHHAEIYLSWDKTQIHFKVETGADKKTAEFIDQNLLSGKSTDPDQYATAAEYYLYLDKDLDKAIKLTDMAIAIKAEAWYYRIKVDVLEKQHKYAEAIDLLNARIAYMQKYEKELGWNSEMTKASVDELKVRVEGLKRKVGN